MEKDFNGWNAEKNRINRERSKLYHERELWWCTLGLNIGSEQDGTGKEYQRPVLILKGMGRDTCYVVPLSTSPHVHKLRIPIGLVDEKQAVALISQIRLIDTRRLVNKIGYLEKEKFAIVRKTAKELL